MGNRALAGISTTYRWAQANALRAAFLIGLAITLLGCCVPRTEPAHNAGVIGGGVERIIVPERTVIGFPLVVWSSPDTHAETDWNFGDWPFRRFFVFWANIWLNGLPALLGMLAHRANTIAFAMPRLIGTLVATWAIYPLLVAPLLLSHWGDVAPRAPLVYLTLYGRLADLSPGMTWAGVGLMLVGWWLFAFPPRLFRLPAWVPPAPRINHADFELERVSTR
jgi:hypothetical protein